MGLHDSSRNKSAETEHWDAFWNRRRNTATRTSPTRYRCAEKSRLVLRILCFRVHVWDRAIGRSGVGKEKVRIMNGDRTLLVFNPCVMLAWGEGSKSIGRELPESIGSPQAPMLLPPFRCSKTKEAS